MSHPQSLVRGTPEAQGIRSDAIHAFVDALERDVRHTHSFMLLRQGHVVAEGWWEPYGPSIPHMLFSLSKSFTSTAIGLLVAEGKLSVDDLVLTYFPDEAPANPSTNLRAMRVRHLLSMSTGHAEDSTRAVFGQTTTEWTRGFLAQPVDHEPGAKFVYDTAATYMLSAIVQRLTGKRMLNYLGSRLFEPLGISDPTWDASPQGIDVGGSGLNITTEDIARFGQLYLQKGKWQDAQLIPEAWVGDATAAHVDTGPSPNPDWEQGYGYQFWRCRHGAYRGDGAFGQFCVVMPEQDAVLAVTSGVGAMQRTLDLVWEHLLPAMKAAPLLENRGSRDGLEERLAGLRLPPPNGGRTSSVAGRIGGRTFAMDENEAKVESIRFDFHEDGCALTIHNDHGEQQIACGYGVWSRGTAKVHQGETWNVAASGAWTDEQTYVAQLWFYETPFGRTLTYHFNGDQLTVDQQLNVSFGPTDQPTLTGRLAS